MNTQKDINIFIKDCVDKAAVQNNPSILAECLGVIARARDNISKVTRDAGINRAGFYRSFRRGGDPKLSTFAKVANSLGYKVTVTPIGQ